MEENLIGLTFGKLLVVSKVSKRRWICKCACGSEKELSLTTCTLVKFKVQSCGCLLAEKTRKRCITHGMSYSTEYTSWAAMKARCLDFKSKDYQRYGKKGITVCGRWLIFENFLEDMGFKPTPKHSLDRIDYTGNYTPENCRWATKKEQANNRISNKLITFNGETLTISEWTTKLGLNRKTISNRLHSGWTEERALTTPLKPRGTHDK